MAKELIITMAAANRAGILAAVTKAMSELGGDLREASQTVVRDHLQDACRPFGIDLAIRDASVQLSAHNAAHAGTRPFRLRVGGRNQPGALRRLSQMMSMKGIDITGMHAVRTEEGRAFEMVLKLAVPQDSTMENLLKELENAGQEFEITADLREFGE